MHRSIPHRVPTPIADAVAGVFGQGRDHMTARYVDQVSFQQTPAPDAVVETLNRLHSDEGHVLDQGIRWIPGRWKTRMLADYESFVDEIVERTDPSSKESEEQIIRRRHLLDLGDDASTLFIGAMIWGSGVRGYGPYRVGSIVQEAGTELLPRLEGLVEAARRGPSDAWDALNSSSKLRGLGPAFGTKVAYFAALTADAPEPRPLIADANTSWAMWELVKLPRSVARRDRYLTYVELAHRWADDHGWRPDDVEWALFEIGRHVRRRVN